MNETGSVFFTVGDSFHIRVLDPDGQITRTYVSPVARHAVSKTDIEDNLVSGIDRLLMLQPGMDSVSTRETIESVRQRRRRMPKASHRETIRQLIVSESGDLLLRRSDMVDRPYLLIDASAQAEWTWLAADGTARARVMLPAGFTPRIFAGCDLYGTSQDEDGSQLVQRYTLAAAACS